MTEAWRVELKLLKEVQAEADRLMREMGGPPLVQAMRDATMIATRTARKEAKVDRGIYRASIVPNIEARQGEVIGIIGSNLAYAPFVVFDTKPHWPRISELTVWARRHGITAFLVARSIARKGTKGDRSLMKGIEQNVERIIALIERAVRRTVEGK